MTFLETVELLVLLARRLDSGENAARRGTRSGLNIVCEGFVERRSSWWWTCWQKRPTSALRRCAATVGVGQLRHIVVDGAMVSGRARPDAAFARCARHREDCHAARNDYSCKCKIIQKQLIAHHTVNCTLTHTHVDERRIMDDIVL